MDRVTVQEAARRLGVTEQAVRKRIKRGTLEAETEAGRVYVYLDEGYEPGQDAVTNLARDALISEMRARIESLERQVEEGNVRDREHRRLLAAALERRQIEAESDAGEVSSSRTPETSTEPSQSLLRRLLRKFSG